MKIRAYADIIKNRKHIAKRYRELEERKIIPDSELIMTLPDHMFIPEELSSKITNKIFDFISANLSRLAKRLF